jgi:hypothetical protein
MECSTGVYPFRKNGKNKGRGGIYSRQKKREGIKPSPTKNKKTKCSGGVYPRPNYLPHVAEGFIPSRKPNTKVGEDLGPPEEKIIAGIVPEG